MEACRGHQLERRWDAAFVQSLLLAVLFVDVAFIIKPRLIYDSFGVYIPYPEFSSDWACLHQALSRAAGPVEYVSAFLSQWFYYSCAGALIVTAVTWLICFATDRLIRSMGGKRWWFLSQLPACVVLVLYQTYHHPLTSLLALAICLWLAVGYETIPIHNAATVRAATARTVLFLTMCLGLYYLAGSVSLLFGLLVGTWYACAKCRPLQAGGAVLASAVVSWWIGTRLFHMTLVEACSVAWPFGASIASDMDPLPLFVLRGLFIFPLLALLTVAACQVLSRTVKVGWPVDAWLDKARNTGFWRRRGDVFPVVAAVLVLALVVVAIHQFQRAPQRQRLFEMVHFTRHREWDQVLQAARLMPDPHYDCFYSHLVNRALYHTDQLGDKMFSFSQHHAGLLLLSNEVPAAPPKFWMLSEIAMEMRDINLAEQWAYQTLEGVGDCPSALETLALICVIKKRNEAARVLLRRMRNDLNYGRRASRLLGLVDQVDLGVAATAEDDWLQRVKRVHTLRWTEDRASQVYSEDFVLENLLKANRHNKMAFEYLMALYLLARRPDKIAENLHRLDDFEYQETPRHYEEAILIHASVIGREGALSERPIRPETNERFNDFVDRCQRWRNHGQIDKVALARDFGDSYWYYYVVGGSGAGGSR